MSSTLDDVGVLDMPLVSVGYACDWLNAEENVSVTPKKINKKLVL